MSIPQQGGGPIESRDDLVSHLSIGCRPPEAWRIGTEHEKFGYRLSDHKPLAYEGACSVRAMLEGLRDRFGWAPVIEGDSIIGLEKNGANVSLEPGGQLELSGAPLETIHQTCDEVNTHLAEVRQVADAIGAGFIGLGAAPIWRHEDMDTMPKGRYAIMKRYMPTVGGRGLHMMFRTCTVQVNLDFGSEADMVKKFRVALALQPIATALFANSPFWEGKPAGMLSYRAHCWQDLDADRTGMLPFAFEDGFGFERYVDFALDVPMYFVYRDGKYIDVAGQSFRDFLKGKLPGLPGELPALSDWADHLTTIFPEARLKSFIEMRGADGGPWRRLCALPALWVGLTYDQTALDAAWDLVKGWTEAEREQLRLDAGVLGLKAEIGGRSLQQLAHQVLEIAEAGLKARARAAAFDHDEAHFLNVLKETVASGRTAADELLEHYHGDWNGDLDRIYAEYSY
jgi:glutamate--cysteine ligase